MSGWRARHRFGLNLPWVPGYYGKPASSRGSPYGLMATAALRACLPAVGTGLLQVRP